MPLTHVKVADLRSLHQSFCNSAHSHVVPLTDAQLTHACSDLRAITRNLLFIDGGACLIRDVCFILQLYLTLQLVILLFLYHVSSFPLQVISCIVAHLMNKPLLN